MLELTRKSMNSGNGYDFRFTAKNAKEVSRKELPREYAGEYGTYGYCSVDTTVIAVVGDKGETGEIVATTYDSWLASRQEFSCPGWVEIEEMI